MSYEVRMVRPDGTVCRWDCGGAGTREEAAEIMELLRVVNPRLDFTVTRPLLTHALEYPTEVRHGAEAGQRGSQAGYFHSRADLERFLRDTWGAGVDDMPPGFRIWTHDAATDTWAAEDGR